MSIVKFDTRGIGVYRSRRHLELSISRWAIVRTRMKTPAPSPTTSQTKWSRIGIVVEGQRWSLSRVVYSQRRCQGIKAAIAPVSCERRRRIGKSSMFYLLLSQSASLWFAATDSSSSQTTSRLTQSVHNHSKARLRAVDCGPLITRASDALVMSGSPSR